MKDRICDNSNISCPCKVADLESGFFYCNFIEMYADLCFHNKTEAANKLIRQVCPEVRNEVLHHDYIETQLQAQEKEFLEKARLGDIVFCTAEIHNVVLMDFPSHEHGYCKYKTINGEIKKAPAIYFRLISEGTKFAEYKTKDEYKADRYDLIARKNGFRVERKMLNNTHILRIFGDTQEEVDQFVNCLETNSLIEDY